MRSQWSFILTLTYGIADAANLALPGVAMVTAAGNLAARQEYTCPTGGVYTWCPGHEGCCLEDEPCITTRGQVKCKAPCYGPSCSGDFCCDIGFECPPPGGKACLQATMPFPPRPSDLTLDFPTIPPMITTDFDETTATSESDTTNSSTPSSYSSPTPKPEPSSVSSTTNSGTSSQEASSTSKTQSQSSEVATTSAAKSSSGGPSGTSPSGPVSTGFAVSLSINSAPWAAWAITWGIGFIFMV